MAPATGGWPNNFINFGILICQNYPKRIKKIYGGRQQLRQPEVYPGDGCLHPGHTRKEICSLCRRKFLLLVELREYVNSNFKNNKLATNQVNSLKQQAAPQLAELKGKTTLPARNTPRRFPWLAGALLGLIFVGSARWLFWPKSNGPILRDSATPSIRLLAPTGKIATPPAEFRWEKMGETKSYEFILCDENLNLIYSQRTTAPQLLLPESKKQVIKKGKKYIWVVKALDGAEVELASASSFFFVE